MIKTNKITHLLPVILHYKSEYCLMDIVMLFPQSFIRVWFFWESRLQHKCTWRLQVLWKFWNFMKFYENRHFWNFLKILKFYESWNFFNFLKISMISLIDDEVRVFQINIKLLSNPVAEIKVRENDSHCRSIVLYTYWLGMRD